jgi:hypothetical protein
MEENEESLITTTVPCVLTAATRASHTDMYASMHLVLSHVAKNQQMVYAALDSEFAFTCSIDGHERTDLPFIDRPWGTRTFCVVDHSDVSKWIKKAAEESTRDGVETVVCLCPARTNTDYFHEIVLKYASSVRFIKGRLKMQNHTKQSPYPSCIVIFGVNRRHAAPSGCVFARPNLATPAETNSPSDSDGESQSENDGESQSENQS